MASSALLSVSATDGPHGPILRLHGEIDVATESVLIQHVESALAERPATLVLDLTGVTFFDVRALSAVIAARQTAVGDSCRLELRSLPPIAERVIDLAGVGDLLATSSDLSAAEAV